MRQPPTMLDAVYLNESLWFPAREFNGLCRCDIKTNIVSFVGCFPEEKQSLRNSHRRCFLVGTQIFCVPCGAKHIHIFDVQMGEFAAVPFRNIVTDACLIGDTIYMFCLAKGYYLYQFNIATKEISLIEEFTLQMDKIPKSQDGNQVLRCYTEDNHIWFGIEKTSLVGCWDISLGKLHMIDTGVEGIFCARCFEENLWITDGRSSSIFCLEKFKQLRKYDISLDTYNTVNSRFRCFNNIFKYEGNLIFVPGYSNKVVVWNGNEMRLFALPMPVKQPQLSLCLRAVKTDRGLLILPFESDYFVCIRRDGVIELRDPMKFSETFSDDLLSGMMRTMDMLMESEYASLEGFLDHII